MAGWDLLRSRHSHGGCAAPRRSVRGARKIPCLPRLRRARHGPTGLREGIRRPDGPLCCGRLRNTDAEADPGTPAPFSSAAHLAALTVLTLWPLSRVQSLVSERQALQLTALPSPRIEYGGHRPGRMANMRR